MEKSNTSVQKTSLELTVKQAVEFLVENNCLIRVGAELQPTAKLYRELGEIKRGSQYMTLREFIKLTEVPSKQLMSDGKFYWLNRPTKDAERIFKQIQVKKTVDIKTLMVATKLYYAQANTLKKTIGNYFKQGIWEGCYEDIIEAIKEDKLPQAIAESLSEGESEHEKSL